ncbi:MAG: IPT/TIG domain-containing protein [Patescibacteria group bacterium]
MLEPVTRSSGKKRSALKTILGGLLSVAVFAVLVFASSSESSTLQAEVAAIPPVVNSIMPTSGDTGDFVYLNGTGLGITAGENTVKFGKHEAAIETVGYAANSTITIVVKVPAVSAVGAYPVTVTTVNGTSVSPGEFSILNTGTTQSPPIINKFEPTSGNPGNFIYISGENFAEKAKDNIIEFPKKVGGTVRVQNIEIVYYEGHRILKLQVPPGVTTGHFTLTVDGLKADSGSDFQVIDLPTSAEDISIEETPIAATANEDNASEPVGNEYLPISPIVEPELPAPELAPVPEIAPSSSLPSPRNLTATPGSNGVQLNWEAPESAEMLAYRVYYSTVSGGYLHRLEAGYANTYLANTNFSANQRYFFVVTAIDAAGTESEPSNEVSVIYQPAWQPAVFAAQTPVVNYRAVSSEAPELSQEGPTEIFWLVGLATLLGSGFIFRRKIGGKF